MTRLQSFDKRELNDRVNLPRMFKPGVPWQDSSPLRFVSMNFSSVRVCLAFSIHFQFPGSGKVYVRSCI